MENNINTGDPIEVVVYTDPLCCWSAAIYPSINRLRQDLNAPLSIRYCLAGMIRDWKSYKDSVNSIDKPVQMGPLWMEVKHITRIELDSSIWVTDPPSSSLPACIAIKTAKLQSSQAEEKMLFALKDAVTKRGLNISKDTVLSKIANDLAVEFPDLFDLSRFKKEYNQQESREELRKDMNEVKLRDIVRLPTLIIKRNGYRSIIITGYRPYDVLLSAFHTFNDVPATEENYK